MRNRLAFLAAASLVALGSTSVADASLGDYTSHTRTASGLVVRAGSDSIVVGVYAPDVVRVDFLPAGALARDSSFSVVRLADPSVPFAVFEQPDRLFLATSRVVVAVEKSPLRLSFREPEGALLLAEPAASGLSASGPYRTARFALPAGLHLYGSGERGLGLDLRGSAFSTYNSQVFGYTGALATMNINVPFLATSSGFGLFFESPLPAWFDLGASDPGTLRFDMAGDELSYVFLAAPDVPGQIERYTWLTGRQPLPPRWALGYLQSKFGYRSRGEAAAMIQTMRSKAIPADAIVLDLYWFRDMGDLAWNTASFPDPAGMIQSFLAAGFKTIVVSEPYFTQSCDHYPYLTGAGSTLVGQHPDGSPYALPGWWSCGCDAVLLDLTNPAARTWLWDRYEDILATGVAGFWTDLGEPENHPWDMRHHLGSADQAHNVYNLLWARSVFEGHGQARPGERIVNLTRSGAAGIQRYGVFTWSGDVGRTFGGLAVQRPILLNMGLSGMGYHSSDLGGFAGSTSPELYVRWMQFGAFNPVMRAHGMDNHLTEPWGFGTEAESIAREFIRLRYRLLPYLYTLVRENHDTGMPLARPLFFADSSPRFADEDGAFLLGRDLLVAPVVNPGQSSKDVPLPRGFWVDYWTDSLHAGGGTATVATPLSKLPVFARSGAILPMQAVMDFVGQRAADTLFLDVFPPATAAEERFELYEDDGATLAYQEGAFARIPLTQRLVGVAGQPGLEITIGAAEGSYPGMIADRVVVATVRRVATPPALVLLGPDTLVAFPGEAELRLAGRGYYHDAARKRLTAQFPHALPSASVLTLVDVLVTATVEPGRGRLVLAPNHPNPFTASTTIRFELPSPGGTASLRIYDVSGRRVRELVSGVLAPGPHEATWDAVDDRGRRVAAGLYFARLEVPGAARSLRLLLLAR